MALNSALRSFRKIIFSGNGSIIEKSSFSGSAVFIKVLLNALVTR